MSEVKVNKISPRTACGTVTVGDSGDAVCVSAGVPVTVQGDLKSPALKATDGGVIISQSGTDITIGASGDTIALACGASQTGFGRTGTVDWVTAIKTTGFTAVSGEGYFCNTTSAGFTVTFPAASVGNIISIADYAGTFASNSVAVSPNGSDNIGGVNGPALLNTNGQSVTFVYADATKGWLIIQDSTETVTGATGFLASGGTVTTCGDYKIHTFTGPGTFGVVQLSPSAPENAVDWLVVGGGAGGGWGSCGGGAGGAGGYRESPGTSTGSYSVSPLAGNSAVTVTASNYSIAVGAGGAASTPPSIVPGINGSLSTFSSYSSAGGGGGASEQPPAPSGLNGLNGASGGGGATGGGVYGGGGTGNTPPTSPAQGSDGGNGNTTTSPPAYRAGGGGGGATAYGTAGSNPNGGTGGAGATSSIDGSSTTRSGGGGGGSGGTCAPGTAGPGGGGTGGAGGNPPAGTPTGHAPTGGNGTDNTGGGAGGGGNGSGGVGGSGVVILRYKYQ